MKSRFHQVLRARCKLGIPDSGVEIIWEPQPSCEVVATEMQLLHETASRKVLGGRVPCERAECSDLVLRRYEVNIRPAVLWLLRQRWSDRRARYEVPSRSPKRP